MKDEQRGEEDGASSKVRRKDRDLLLSSSSRAGLNIFVFIRDYLIK